MELYVPARDFSSPPCLREVHAADHQPLPKGAGNRTSRLPGTRPASYSESRIESPGNRQPAA